MHSSVTRSTPDDCIVPELDSRRGVHEEQPVVSSVAYSAAIDQLANQLCVIQSATEVESKVLVHNESVSAQGSR